MGAAGHGAVPHAVLRHGGLHMSDKRYGLCGGLCGGLHGYFGTQATQTPGLLGRALLPDVDTTIPSGADDQVASSEGGAKRRGQPLIGGPAIGDGEGVALVGA